jgi:hypothetical protein
VDVHSDFHVFLKPVKPYLPLKDEATVGRTPSRYRVDQQSVRIDAWAKRLPQSAWRKIEVRESTKGVLEYEYLTVDCWIWEKDTKNVYRWRLVVRRNPVTKVELLGATLPSKSTSLKEIEAAMEARHRKRQQAIDSALKCQGAR